MKNTILLTMALVFTACSENSDTKQQVVQKEVFQKTKKIQTPVHKETNISKVSVKSPVQVYVKCAGCHGQNAEKSALGKSKIIQGWDAEKIRAALNGYKNDTYGGTMQGLMRGQVMPLSEADIISVSEYISKL